MDLERSSIRMCQDVFSDWLVFYGSQPTCGLAVIRWLIDRRAFFPSQEFEGVLSSPAQNASPTAVPGNIGLPAFDFPFSRSVIVSDFFFSPSIGMKGKDHRDTGLGKAGDDPCACG